MNLFARLRYLFRRQRVEEDMAEEMRFHLEQRAADLAATGLSAEEARFAAQRRFGNTARLQEQAREDRGWGWLERFRQDLVQAARQLRRAPAFSLLAIVTLGLGIGANTAMFSVLNGILLKPLPYPDLEQLERFYRSTPAHPDGNFSAADFLELRTAGGNYGEVAAYTPAGASLSEPGFPAEMAYAARATADLFTLLGVQPQQGRIFRPDEDSPGRDRVVIISHRMWRNRFDRNPDVIGRTIRVDGEPHEIIGVLPESFNDWRYLGVIDFFRPLALTAEQARDRHATPLRVVGRRGDRLTAAESAAFASALGARLAREFSETNAGSSWRTVSLQEDAAGSSGLVVLPMLIALSAAVLLIACSNLANLLLARTMARSRELAVRAALGASRLQLLRPLFLEALLLSLAGGALALLIADAFNHWAAVRSTGDNGEQVHFVLDQAVLGWALLASLVTATAFAVAPALFALRLDLNQTLKSGGRGATSGPSQQRFRQLLIVAQFALAMVLLAGAALFMRGLGDLQNRRSGWETSHVITGSVLLPTARYRDADKLTAFHRLALERLAALPGVAAVSLSAATPFFDWSDIRKFIVEGRALPPPGQEPAAMVNVISPGYLATFNTRLVAGRTFTDRDNAGATRVALVSQSTARALFGTAEPIGHRLAVAGGPTPAWAEVVGVVADIQSSDPEPGTVSGRVYFPLAQEPRGQLEVAVRTSGADPVTLVDPLRAAMTELDGDLPIRRLAPADVNIDRTFYQLRFLRDMLTAIGLLGLALASLGIYGVVTRTMAQRTDEFAVRLALGASAADITRLVLGSGVRQALLGSALGLLGALAVSAGIAAAFPGIRTNNFLVLGATTGVLVSIALVACWLPARRAGRIDAISALRSE